MSRALLITGATGKQGGSVIRALLQVNAEFEILAVTRNTGSPSAQRLLKSSPRIKLVGGNLDAPYDIFKAAKEISQVPISGVFSVQTAFGKSEETQGKALIDASIDNDVKTFVYSSVDRGGMASSNTSTNVPHFISKHNIEQHLFQQAKKSGLQWTVLRPVAFMENLTPGFLGKVFSTSWRITLKDEKPLQLIATSDIGFFGAQAFSHPEKFSGVCLSLAGDELKFSEYKRIFEEGTSEKLPTTYPIICTTIQWLSKEFGYMFRWFRTDGYRANIPELRKMNPQLMDFATWLQNESAWKKKS